MAKVLINETSLSGIAEAIRAKNGSSETYKPSEMAAAIEAIEAGGGGADLPEEAFTITGNCEYRFAYGGWDWFIEHYGDKVTTQDITNCQKMFSGSKIEQIPFDINLNNTSSEMKLDSMFNGAYYLKSAPAIKGILKTPVSNYSYNPPMTSIFSFCYCLREIDYNYFNNFGGEEFWAAAKTFTNGRGSTFLNCYSLRQHPDLSNLINAGTNAYSGFYYSLFGSCYALDAAMNLPIKEDITYTSSMLLGVCNNCARLKNLTFATPDGAPYVVKWKSQTLDLSSYVGYSYSAITSYILNYNSGITADKRVKDDATYQALKNDPDWFTEDINYSRYNHDSAVATINSLPDASAYLAEKGGTNTIKFKGASGSKTDGGAINTLTDAEIAVAAAKGWTVTLV